MSWMQQVLPQEVAELIQEGMETASQRLGTPCPLLFPGPKAVHHSAVSNSGSKSSVGEGAMASGVSKFATSSLHDQKERHKDHKQNHSMGHRSGKSSDELNRVTKTRPS